MGRSEGARAAWLERYPAQPLSPNTARRRALGQAAIGLAAVAGLLWWGHRTIAVVASAVILTVVLLAWLSPHRATPAIQRVLVSVGQGVGRVVAALLLAPFFYLVLTPLGIALRLTRADPLRRRPDPEAGSYWQKPHRPWGANPYRRQS